MYGYKSCLAQHDPNLNGVPSMQNSTLGRSKAKSTDAFIESFELHSKESTPDNKPPSTISQCHLEREAMTPPCATGTHINHILLTLQPLLVPCIE